MRGSRIMVVSLAIILSGCAQYRTLAPAALLELGPERLLQQVAERAGEIGNLRTTGTILIRSDRGAFSARGVVLYAEPDSIRLDISITLGGIVAQGVIAGGTVQIYMPTEQMVMVGEIGDVLWYAAMLARELDLDLGEIGQANLDKLASRKERGVLTGSGDDR